MHNNSYRYYKQIILDGWGHKAQEKLHAASIAIVGLGGLGSVVSTHLTLAGIGNLKLFDFDVVEFSNLNMPIVKLNRNGYPQSAQCAKSGLPLIQLA